MPVIQPGIAPRVFQYERHQPENTLLYQIIERYYPEFMGCLEAQGKSLPQHVQDEFEAYLKCGRLEHGFMRVCCEQCRHEQLVAFSCKRRGFCPSCGAKRMVEGAALLLDEVLPEQPMRQWVLSVPFGLRWVFAREPELMGKVLGIVTRGINGYLIKQAGHTQRTAKTGAVTLIQRFGSALNLNIHFHMLYLDGVYVQGETAAGKGGVEFQEVLAPTQEALTKLLQKLSERVANYLERAGIIERDLENSYLNQELFDEDGLMDLQGHSIQYRIAVGPQRGQKVLMLQTLPPSPETSTQHLVAKLNGFSLHAGVAAKRHQRDKLERLCRYISRPAVSTKRLSLTRQGKVRYELKTAYRDGTSHVIFEPLDFISRLASLVPKPRVNLTRFHGVFAPNHKWRGKITGQAKKPSQASTQASDEGAPKTEGERRAGMTWAQRLKRVFNIDIEVCKACGGKMKVVACIEEPVVIKRILSHLKQKGGLQSERNYLLPESRGPPSFPQTELFMGS